MHRIAMSNRPTHTGPLRAIATLMVIMLGIAYLPAHFAFAATSVHLVKDINPTNNGSKLSNLTNLNGTLFFGADDGVNGSELWKSDGTAAGTTLVRDINTIGMGSDPSNLININGTLFFSADDGLRGTELWKSDGTAAGTTLVRDITISPSSSIPNSGPTWVNVNGTLFFVATDGFNGYELWKSDGTDAGTSLVKNINFSPGPDMPMFLTNVNGMLFFTADDGSNGYELWKSDGTDAGTTLVKDINTMGMGSDPYNLTNVNGTLFFAADDGANGYELWKSDGTDAGTTLVKDINALPGSDSLPGYLTNVNGTLFFAADDGTNGEELWKSDGTNAGTTLVKDINPLSGSCSTVSNLIDVNGTLFFAADDGTNGVELWKSDGTAAGTTLVKDINPGHCSSPADMTNVNGTLFFSADDGTHGFELWQSDGTSAGTVLVEDIYTGAESSIPFTIPPIAWAAVNGSLFFAADDGITGLELWRAKISTPPLVTGNGQTIVAGDATPSIVDGTDFGAVEPGLSTARTFTIVSPADAIPVITISGLAAGDFSATQTTTLQGVVITITFTPSAAGLRSATIHLTSDDYDPTSFTFAVQGTGEQFRIYLPLITTTP